LIYRFFGKVRLNIWIISGKERLAQHPLDINFVGAEINKNYITNLAFNSLYSEINIGKWLWDLFEITKKRKSSCFFMILEINKTFQRFFDNKTLEQDGSFVHEKFSILERHLMKDIQN
jgi:uncharacterized protein YeaC (DUF1315 family)